MGKVISNRARIGQKSFCFGEIDGQNAQMFSKVFELWLPGSFGGKKEFLKNYGIDGEPDTTGGLSGKKLRCRWLAPEITDDHVRIQKHERPFKITAVAGFERFLHLPHDLILRDSRRNDCVVC